MTRLALVAYAAVSFFPSLALAHPGHGSTDHAPILHHLVEPLHASVLVAVLVAGALVVARAAAKRRRRE